ncbi:MAG: Cys-Cys-COOH (seleno)protein SaoC [Syntrophomonadaceae bacterium]
MMRAMTRNFLIVLLIICLAGCSTQRKADNNPAKVGQETPALQYWRSNNSYSPIMWIEADLDNDSRMDTVLIYRETADKCMLCVVLNTVGGFVVSESTRAPLENQIIQSKDIDQKPPVEIIVSGSKNGKYGYGIFRLENNQLIDLFADGMNDCC